MLLRSRPTVEIHVPISPSPVFLNMAHYLVRSLRARGGRHRRAPVFLTIGDAQIDEDIAQRHRWLARDDVALRWVGAEDYATHSYFATAAERFRHPFDSDVVLALDADVLIAGALDELVEIAFRTGALCGVVAHMPPFSTAGAWDAIWERCGLGAVDRCCEHTGWGYMFADEERRYCPPYFNLGVLAAPPAVMARLGQDVYADMRAIDEVQACIYRLQVAVAVAVARHRLPTRPLPFRWNFANDPQLEALHAGELEHARVLHLLRSHQIDKRKLFASIEEVEAMLRRTDLRVINAMAQDVLREVQPRVRAEHTSR